MIMEALRCKLQPQTEEETTMISTDQSTTFEQTPPPAKHKPAVTFNRSKLTTSWNLLKRRIGSTTVSSGAQSNQFRRGPRQGTGSSTSQSSAFKMENTYRIVPDDRGIFPPAVVQKEIVDVLEGVLGNMEYNPDTSGRIAMRLSEAIKTRVKALHLKRYKLVVHVLLGSRDGQDLEMGSMSLWSHETDNYASASYQNASLFALATVFGVYFE